MCDKVVSAVIPTSSCRLSQCCWSEPSRHGVQSGLAGIKFYEMQNAANLLGSAGSLRTGELATSQTKELQAECSDGGATLQKAMCSCAACRPAAGGCLPRRQTSKRDKYKCLYCKVEEVQLASRDQQFWGRSLLQHIATPAFGLHIARLCLLASLQEAHILYPTTASTLRLYPACSGRGRVLPACPGSACHPCHAFPCQTFPARLSTTPPELLPS